MGWYQGAKCTFMAFIVRVASVMYVSAALILTDSLCRPQARRTASGRAACRTSVARSCSKPSTTCWSAASWTAALCASGSGLWSPTRRTRSPSTRGLSGSVFGGPPLCSGGLFGSTFFTMPVDGTGYISSSGRLLKAAPWYLFDGQAIYLLYNIQFVKQSTLNDRGVHMGCRIEIIG